MNLWLSLPFLSAPDLRALAVAAEEAGIAGLAVSDHVCVPVAQDSPYPYGSGVVPTDVDYPDPLVAIATLAGATSRVRFMTAVLIAPLRHPVALAKAAATAAAMSDGRLDLGLGVGWLREEFEAVGVNTFEERGPVTDEMLALLRELWTGQPIAHHGRYFAFDALTVNPRADIPIFVGGHSPPALRRAAAHADGWVGVNPNVEELAGIVESLRRATADRPFEIRSGIKGTLTPERVAAVRAMGVDSLLIAPWQIGERRDSVFDQPAAELIEGLPIAMERVLAA